MRFDLAGIYHGLRRGLLDLAPDLSDEEWSTTAPATPEWTVKDLYAHLAGVAADILAGNVVLPGTDEWTAKQVADRAGLTPEQICAEWAGIGLELESLLDGSRVAEPVIDLWHHDQDARNAIGHRANREGDGLLLALRSGNVLGAKVVDAGLPTLAISVDGYERVFGDGEPAASLSSDPYELARAFMGRRSERQIRAFDWKGDPEPYLLHFAVFPPRDTDLIE